MIRMQNYWLLACEFIFNASETSRKAVNALQSSHIWHFQISRQIFINSAQDLQLTIVWLLSLKKPSNEMFSNKATNLELFFLSLQRLLFRLLFVIKQNRAFAWSESVSSVLRRKRCRLFLKLSISAKEHSNAYSLLSFCFNNFVVVRVILFGVAHLTWRWTNRFGIRLKQSQWLVEVYKQMTYSKLDILSTFVALKFSGQLTSRHSNHITWLWKFCLFQRDRCFADWRLLFPKQSKCKSRLK